VGDELVAGAAHLIRVALAGEDEGALDRAAVERLGTGSVGARVELLDQREEVPEQGALLGVQRPRDVVERRRLVLGRGGADLRVAVAIRRDLWLGLVGA
jgi:hypothetical protein